ncbi:MAG: Dam family site-specific DNA-(adenine-N6)-methyltransferase [Limnochordia bacterium]|nr:Dam family site-specific DNA-(adenine-N6)-methyltransferase [Limnochordia bacterium]
MTTVTRLNPPLKWAGGKRWLVPSLATIWEPYQQGRLLEPFCGGLAVALGLAPSKALLNDVNPHLINFYRWVQRGLIVSLDMANDKDAYYRSRSRFNELIRAGETDSQEAAELFYYLNRTGYNGLCRFNKKGQFNVPFGRYKRINYLCDFRDYRSLFKKWELQVGDFERLDLLEDDFIYADPPYDVEFTQYAPQGFTWEDQVRLATWLAQHQGPVVASNQATKRIIELYSDLGFHLLFFEAPRRISCTGDRTPAREILAKKPK